MQNPTATQTSGFDPSEPRARFIGLLGLGIMAALVAIILGLQSYVDHVREQQVFVKQLQPVSEDLKALRAREDADLNSYRYIDRAKGTVRIPIRRAMELLAREYAAGTAQFPTKPVPAGGAGK